MTDADKKNALRAYLRRKYARDVPGLRALSDELVLKGALDPVTITSLSAEGGSGTGVLTSDPLLLLGVIEEVLTEIDPEAPQPLALDTAIVRFV